MSYPSANLQMVLCLRPQPLSLMWCAPRIGLRCCSASCRSWPGSVTRSTGASWGSWPRSIATGCGVPPGQSRWRRWWPGNWAPPRRTRTHRRGRHRLEEFPRCVGGLREGRLSLDQVGVIAARAGEVPMSITPSWPNTRQSASCAPRSSSNPDPNRDPTPMLMPTRMLLLMLTRSLMLMLTRSLMLMLMLIPYLFRGPNRSGRSPRPRTRTTPPTGSASARRGGHVRRRAGLAP